MLGFLHKGIVENLPVESGMALMKQVRVGKCDSFLFRDFSIIPTTPIYLSS